MIALKRSYCNSVVFGPFLQNPDDVLHLWVPRASQHRQDLLQCLSRKHIR